MDDSNFVGAVSTLEGWVAAFEWDLLRMDKWAYRNLMKQGKCRIPYLGWNKLTQQDLMGSDVL